ncbi:four helix bundle protein [Prevotella sp. HUN102]|nr:four helix bundle protein [Prevotella sp. HUN102]
MVWQKSILLVKRIYQTTKSFPKEENSCLLVYLTLKIKSKWIKI